MFLKGALETSIHRFNYFKFNVFVGFGRAWLNRSDQTVFRGQRRRNLCFIDVGGIRVTGHATFPEPKYV